MTIDAQSPITRSKLLSISVWAARGLIAFFFLWGAYMKLCVPFADAAKMMPWVAEHTGLARFTGVVDLLGGIGIIFPSLLRIQPRLSMVAAIGIVVLQMFAMCFHLMRGEAMVLPMNILLFGLAIFVLWSDKKNSTAK